MGFSEDKIQEVVTFIEYCVTQIEQIKDYEMKDINISLPRCLFYLIKNRLDADWIDVQISINFRNRVVVDYHKELKQSNTLIQYILNL
ncbi:hypothetical protein D3C86_537170 [compost metagenome]